MSKKKKSLGCSIDESNLSDPSIREFINLHCSHVQIRSDFNQESSEKSIKIVKHSKIGVSLNRTQINDVLKVLSDEIQSKNPRSLNKISKDIGISDISLAELAKKSFPKEYEKIWSKKIPTIRYNTQHDLIFKEIFEKKGTYQDVRKHIIKTSNGSITPKISTISKHLKNLFSTKRFLFNGYNTFKDWYDKHSKHNEKSVIGGFKGEVYSKDDVLYWIDLFKELGSFNAVSKYISKKNNSKMYNSTIQDRIEKFLTGKNIDFEEWIKKYHNDYYVWHAQSNKRRYSIRDNKVLKELYEDLGSFIAVADEFFQISGIKIKYQTVKSRMEKFLGEHFEHWRNKFYSDKSEIAINVGNLIHNILEHLFIEFCNGYLELQCFFEVKPRFLSNNFRIDNSIIRNRKFIERIENCQDILVIPNNIKIINIDYTISRNERNIRYKLSKGYYGPHMFLIIVALRDDIFYSDTFLEIKKLDNVVVINIDDFIRFLGMDKTTSYRNIFCHIVSTALDIIENNGSIEPLISLAIDAKRRLKKSKLNHLNYARTIRRLQWDYLFYAPELKASQKRIVDTFYSNILNFYNSQ